MTTAAMPVAVKELAKPDPDPTGLLPDEWLDYADTGKLTTAQLKHINGCQACQPTRDRIRQQRQQARKNATVKYKRIDLL